MGSHHIGIWLQKPIVLFGLVSKVVAHMKSFIVFTVTSGIDDYHGVL